MVYENPLAGLVVHRLMWRVPPLGEPRVAFTKGDALLYLDRPFAIEDVMGRVIEVAGSRGRRKIERRVGGFRGLTSWLGAAAAMTWRRGMTGMARKALARRKKR